MPPHEAKCSKRLHATRGCPEILPNSCLKLIHLLFETVGVSLENSVHVDRSAAKWFKCYLSAAGIARTPSATQPPNDEL